MHLSTMDDKYGCGGVCLLSVVGNIFIWKVCVYQESHIL